ncbi:MAG: hypothetical protein FJ304_13705 [Planctomycetes bacterium]|nr:hypothetical protein [Planctomycetota bacterium]
MTPTRAKWLRWLGPLTLLAAVAAFYLVNRATRPPDWARHATSDGACSAEFPLAPARDTEDDADRMEVVRADRDARYSLTFSDLSEKDAAEPPDVVFALLRAKFVLARATAGAPVKLIRDRTITEGGHEGREYQFTVGDKLVSRIKVFRAGRRVYRAIAVNPPDATLDADAQRFLDSLRFEKQ